MKPICPACGHHEVDTPSGFCSSCVVERAATNYSEEDRNLAARRAASWARTQQQTRTDARLAALRQQRHRLAELIRPRRKASSVDPWEVARDAIRHAQRLALATETNRRELAEEVIEGLRRLAWGPDDDADWIEHRPGRRRRQIPGQLCLWSDDEQEVAA